MAYVSLPAVPLKTCPVAPHPIQSVSHISESNLSIGTHDILEAKGSVTVHPIFILVHSCDRIDPDDVISLFKLDTAAATYIAGNLGIMKPKDVTGELADELGSRTNTNDFDTAVPGVLM